MTEAELTEAFQLIRDNSSPLVHPLLDSLERLYAIDRADLELQRVKVGMVSGVVGHRVYDDNHQHSRRVPVCPGCGDFICQCNRHSRNDLKAVQ